MSERTLVELLDIYDFATTAWLESFDAKDELGMRDGYIQRDIAWNELRAALAAADARAAVAAPWPWKDPDAVLGLAVEFDKLADNEEATKRKPSGFQMQYEGIPYPGTFHRRTAAALRDYARDLVPAAAAPVAAAEAGEGERGGA